MKKLVVLASVVGLLMCGTAWGTQFWIIEDTGDYAVPENWVPGPGLPGHPDNPNAQEHGWEDGWIGRGENAVAQLSTDVREFDGEPSLLRIMWITGYATLEVIDGGVIQAEFSLGRDQYGDGWSGPGTLLIQEGASITGPPRQHHDNKVNVGVSGSHTEASIVEQYGGTVDAAVFVGLAHKGEYHLFGGAITPRQYQNLVLGYNAGGDGFFVQHPGTSVQWDRSGFIGLAGTGEYRMLGGTMGNLDVSRVFSIGGGYTDNWNLTGGIGTLIHEDGDVTSAGRLYIGVNGGTGLYHISGGSLSAVGMILGHLDGNGTFRVTGADATSITVNGTARHAGITMAYLQYPGGTLMFDIGEDGITPISVNHNAIFEDGAMLTLNVPDGLYIPKDTVFTLMTCTHTMTDNGLVLDAESAEEWEFFIANNTLFAKYTGLRPEITEFTVTGDTASELFTRTAQVNAALSANPSDPLGEIVGWMVTETDYPEPPDVEDENWLEDSPAFYDITDLPGSLVTLYAWVIDNDGQASKSTATILYQPQDPVIFNVQVTPDAELIEALITWDTDVPAYGNISYLVGGWGETTEFVGPTTSHSASMMMGLPDEEHDIIIRSNATTLEIVWPEPDVVYPSGDANQDCVVDLLDLVFVRNQLFADIDENNITADVNEDDVIDLQDLIEVRNNLGAVCEEPENL